MKRALALIAALSVSACSAEPPMSPGVKDCWRLGKALMRSPSTAKYIEGYGGEKAAFISMDAANAYGTPVRTQVSCVLEDVSGVRRVKSVMIDGELVDEDVLITARSSLMIEDLNK